MTSHKALNRLIKTSRFLPCKCCWGARIPVNVKCKFVSMYFTNHSPSVAFILFQSPLGTDDLMHSMRRLLQGGLEAKSMMDARMQEQRKTACA